MWTGENQQEVFDFLSWDWWDKKSKTAGGKHFYIDHEKVQAGLIVKSSHGDMLVHVGDFVVKSPYGFHPCEPRVFVKLYEKNSAQ